MHGVEVLVLHGSPGSGKSTLANALFERLRTAGQPSAVIDRDELSLVNPYQGYGFSLRNLQTIWPNHAAVNGLRAVIPTVIADADDHRGLREALPASRFVICELIAPKAVLISRVTAREPNDFWRRQLEKWVDVYSRREASQKFGDFQVITHGKSVDDAATEILEEVGWQSPEQSEST